MDLIEWVDDPPRLRIAQSNQSGDKVMFALLKIICGLCSALNGL